MAAWTNQAPQPFEFMAAWTNQAPQPYEFMAAWTNQAGHLVNSWLLGPTRPETL